MSGRDCYYNPMNATADTLLPRLHTPQVRDLAWACFSQPLLDCALLQQDAPPVSNCRLALNADRRRWLQDLDTKPAPLLAFLGDSRARRLGLYFERLWQFFLDTDPAVTLLAHNLAIDEKGRTLGEFDCLYYCHARACHVHLELAVKFYLLRPGADGSLWRHWIGPNVADRLDRKLQRLFDHQLRLGDTAAARPALAALGIDRLQRELEIKGRLFCAGQGVWCRPPGVPAAVDTQRYYAISELREQPLDCPAYRLLERHDWFASVNAACDADLHGADSLRDALARAFARRARPVQVARCDSQGAELGRFFVVPDSWPASANAGERDEGQSSASQG